MVRATLRNAGVSTGRELETFHGKAQHLERLGVGLGKLVEHLLCHLCVAMDAAPFPASPEWEMAETLGLDFAGSDDALANGGAGFAGLHLAELGEGHGLNFAVDVNAVEIPIANSLCYVCGFYLL